MNWKIIKEKLGLILICLTFVLLGALPNMSQKEPVMISLSMVSIAISVIYAYKTKLFSLKDLQINWKRVLWLVVMFVLLYLLGELGDLLTAWEGIEETHNQKVINEEMLHVTPLAHFITTVIVAPIVEEVLFRGIIPQLLFKKHPKLGYLVGAILFGFVHSISSISEAVIYIGGGLVFALTCYRHDRLSDSMIIHMIYNAL